MFVSSTKEKILRLFFNNPRSVIHQRGIARRTKVVPGNVSRYLKEFVQEGLLIRNEMDSLIFFKLNPKCDFIFKVFELFEVKRKTEFFAQYNFSKNDLPVRFLPRYTENLTRLSRREIQMIVLYGDVARGRWTEEIPVEVLIVTSPEFDNKKVLRIHDTSLKRITSLLKFEPFHISMDEFREGMRLKQEFYKELWIDRIVLYNEFLFWQLTREASFKFF
jgi:predicted nucleotidyltransferase